MKKKKKWIFPVVCLLIAAFIIALPKIIQNSRDNKENKATIRTAVAGRKDIETTLSGTGTLTSEDSEDIEVPSGVDVTGYLVSNGELVVKGQPLVSVDRDSVQQAIKTCQATIDHLEEKMFALEYNEATRYIMVPATGTVKAIYCKKGDRVADVMLEHGCLGIIEIDGEEWKAQAFTGTVQFVNAQEGQQVLAHNTFIWLDDLSEMSEYDTLLAQHQDYEELMEDLFSMYETGAICAPCDGLIDGIDKEKVKKVQSVSDPELVDKLTELEESERKNNPGSGFPFDFENMPAGFGSGSFPEGFEPGNMPEGFEPGNMPENFSPENFSDSERPQPPAGEAPISAAPAASVSDGEKVLTVTSLTYTGEKQDTIPADKIANIPGGGTGGFPGGGGGFGGIGGINLPDGEQVNLSVDLDKSGTIKFERDGEDVTDKVKFNGGSVIAYTPDGGTSYNIVGIDANALIRAYQQIQQEMMSKLQDMMKSMMGMMGGFGGMGASGTGEEEDDFDMYPLDGEVIMTVTPQATLSIDITIDELDILSAALGQEAQITIDALPGRAYFGTVTKINSEATLNDGGQTKFGATVTMDMDNDLLAGMNASTLITIATKNNVLSVPAKALYEQGTKTMVYTGYDEKEKVLTGSVTVTTGASDGENVEILSGLSEGDSVIFEYEDTVNVDDMTSQPGLSLANMLSGGR
ncbi:MAG: HlyD family efflux transporter periplasmic adaptor subunit [Eubacteriales bacterium]|nr:HlyD family efflux transporter periplasmic adaptor subunit [Eubacteriales bacterium]